MIAATLLAAALAAAPPPGAASPARTVEVELLAQRPCQALWIEGPGGRRHVALSGGRLTVDGRPVEAPLRLPAARWRVGVPAPAERDVEGALEIRAGDGRLRPIARLPLEAYVAWTVASETEPATPPAALRAQAVVARSYAVAGGRRHADVDMCDLAHCQVLRGGLDARHRAAARQAAEATRGEVLRLPSGELALATFHAACGGHTADPREVFGGAATGAEAVPDDGCPPRPWRAVVPWPAFEAVARERLGAPAPPEALSWRSGRGGAVAQVALGERVAGGEAFARALDGRLGHRQVRSARFTARSTAAGVLLDGTGLGHGVGLCQAGAARRAAAGATHAELLRRYFPGAVLSRLDAGAPGPARRGAAAPAALTTGGPGGTIPLHFESPLPHRPGEAAPASPEPPRSASR